MDGHASALPPSADVTKIAYHFVGDYRSGAREAPELMERSTRR
jgi:hypothetical protein